ncbi:MAG: RluA family pseudouridine synthase [Faecalibacterium sp.]|jgi:23S rRNA pseudouridine1911/1915/1917 synthase|nr:RluA family pseudouridine synthase [Faecalibacterium sp.]
MQLGFAVVPEWDGMLLRTFLRQCAVSSDLARAVKYRGDGFFVDGVPVHTTACLRAGQNVTFSLPPEATAPTRPQPEIGLTAVYEDAFATMLEKPAGIAVHPTLNYPDGTLANGWAARALRQGGSGVFRPVNRLDKNTSGLLLAAQNMYAAPLLAGHVQKLYYAVAEGEMPLGPGVFDGPIGRRGDSIIGRCVTPEGKPSRTEYTVLRAENGCTLAACRPVTGRTHQIRVHFAHAGFPLAGDTLYGGHTGRIARHALHCAEMTFSVPEYRMEGGRVQLAVPLRYHTITCKSALPADMEIL